MVRTQLYLPDDLHRAAKYIAGSNSESLANLLRRFICQGVSQEQTKVKTQKLSSLADLHLTGGPADLSEHLDDYLYK